MAKQRLDRKKLLGRLERVKYKPDTDGADDQLQHMSVAGALLALAEIDHDHEYALCTKVTRHLLGTVPEPDDVSMLDA
jgi:hypothetical protein